MIHPQPGDYRIGGKEALTVKVAIHYCHPLSAFALPVISESADGLSTHNYSIDAVHFLCIEYNAIIWGEVVTRQANADSMVSSNDRWK